MVKKLFLVSCIGLLIGANLFAAVPKNTKLCNAVEKGKIEAVKKELTKNPEDINKKGDRHETPVTKAARIKDNTEILDLLIKAGGEVTDNSLYVAQMSQNTLYFKYLIENDLIDVNENISKLYFLFNKKEFSIEDIIFNVKDVTCGKLNTPYILKFFDKDDYNLVIESFNLDLNVPVDKVGTTILQMAAKSFDVDLVEFLISRVDINQKNNNGANALFYACTAYGPSINLSNPITEDADIAKINFISDMPYYRNAKEIQQKQLKIVSLLFDANIDTNAQDVFGWTTLHYASAFYPEGLQELLISKGSNVNLKTNFGRTARDIKNLKK